MGFFPLEFFVGVQRGGNSGKFQFYIGGSVGGLVSLFYNMITRKYRHIKSITFIYIKVLTFISRKK